MAKQHVFRIVRCDRCNYQRPAGTLGNNKDRCVVCRSRMRQARVILRQGKQVEV